MNIAGNVPPSGGTTPTDPAPELARLLFEPNISINGPIGQDTVTFFSAGWKKFVAAARTC
ncbi:MAG: hypothetical protein EOR94_16485 [Mesorhizobium sp.]|nr:MAG: hypothetical protein EOR94_16485 [Mesorhizobium sp.]